MIQFQLSYIRDTTNYSYNILVKLFRDVHHMWWWNQELEELYEVQKEKILDIIMFVPYKNPPGYKEHVIYFIVFAFGEGVTTIYWLESMKNYVSDIVK